MDEQQIEESLTNHNIDMLLNLIAKNDCLVESSEFPMKYDYAQPAKRLGVTCIITEILVGGVISRNRLNKTRPCVILVERSSIEAQSNQR
jgi:hypothetical protein